MNALANKKYKPSKTPLPKGLLNYCPSCVHYIANSELRYPCTKSHSQIRRAANINYAREFKECVLFEERFISNEEWMVG